MYISIIAESNQDSCRMKPILEDTLTSLDHITRLPHLIEGPQIDEENTLKLNKIFQKVNSNLDTQQTSNRICAFLVLQAYPMTPKITLCKSLGINLGTWIQAPYNLKISKSIGATK